MDELTKEDIKGYIEDLVANFLWYDRKDDDDLPVGEIERMVNSGVISVDEMVNEFRLQLESRIVK